MPVVESSAFGIIKLAERALRALRRGRVPLHSSRKANHVFTQHQLLACLVIQQKERKDYRSMQGLLEEHQALREALGLRRAPHFSTLQKALKRLRPLAERLFAATLLPIQGPVALDGTGFSSRHASRYYGHRIHEERLIHHHVRSCIAVDTAAQRVVAHRERDGPGADFPDAIPLLRQLRGVRIVVADKGFDSLAIRWFVRWDLHAAAHIPQRRQAYGRRGLEHRHAAVIFDERLYHRRSLVETVHSVVKRRYGDALRSRAWPCWGTEVTLRYVAYNLGRASTTVWLLMISTEPSPTHQFKAENQRKAGESRWKARSSFPSLLV